MNNEEYLKNGLSAAEAEERAEKGLTNDGGDTPTKSVGQIIRTNLCTFFNFLNLVLALAVILVGSPKNALFVGVIFCNTVIGIVQEIRAKRVIDKLSLISAPKATVMRGGEKQEIDIKEIVLDDLLLLSSGKQICTDCEILEGECEVNESLITGESDPVYKKAGEMLMSGSFVVCGNVKAKAVHVGKDNFASKITGGAKYIKKHNSKMLHSLDVIVKVVAICIVPVAAGLFLNGIFRTGSTFADTVISTVAGVIGMIPEGLILLASVVLAVSVIRLSFHKTLVQDMYCIETLARVDTLCLDKTGTITEGSMQVENVAPLDENFPLEERLKAYIGACADDNPTFNAIKEKWGGADSTDITRTLPFSSAKKWSGVETSSRSLIFGAPEFVLGDRFEPLREQCEAAACEGQRVLLFAYSDEPFNDRDLPENVVPAALIFIGDKIRKEAPETLEFFDSQGVDIKIISGDNPVTVSKIAQRAGVKNWDKAVDASTLSDEEISEAVKKYSVFGRVKPHQKLAMVKALKEQGRTVGMTGDGVNDVLALKEADCSIAMQSGSDAARAVSNLVLLDSNFASMPKVVAEGRRSVNNVERSAVLFLTKTVYSFILSFVFLLIPEPFPFEPIQMTLISSMSIGAPSFLLALEPNFDIIRGSFIGNSMRRSLPRGVAIAICIGLVMVMSEVLQLTVEETSTLATITMGALSFIVLTKVAMPLKWWKTGMIIVLAAAFAGAMLLVPWLVSITPVTWQMLACAAGITLFGGVLMFLLEKLASPIIEKILNRRAKCQK